MGSGSGTVSAAPPTPPGATPSRAPRRARPPVDLRLAGEGAKLKIQPWRCCRRKMVSPLRNGSPPAPHHPSPPPPPSEIIRPPSVSLTENKDLK